MRPTTLQVGPDDNGRRMSLADFESASGQSGYSYELSRGVVQVVEVPNPEHLAQINAIRRQLAAYDLQHPGQIYALAGGGECKILLTDLEAERHPDVAVYKTPPPDEEDVWAAWVPEVVVEVVSAGSEHRDYEEKPQEYLAFGVREYWIVDAARQEVRVLRRSRGRWAEQILRPPTVYRTRLLPGLRFDCRPVFEAAERR